MRGVWIFCVCCSVERCGAIWLIRTRRTVATNTHIHHTILTYCLITVCAVLAQFNENEPKGIFSTCPTAAARADIPSRPYSHTDTTHNSCMAPNGTAIVCQRDSTGMAYYIRNVHVRQLTCPIYERYERDFDTIALPHHHHAHRTYMQISVVNGWWVKNATLYAGWMMVRWTWTCATWRRTTTTTPTSHWRSGWGLLTCCVRIY